MNRQPCHCTWTVNITLTLTFDLKFKYLNVVLQATDESEASEETVEEQLRKMDRV